MRVTSFIKTQEKNSVVWTETSKDQSSDGANGDSVAQWVTEEGSCATEGGRATEDGKMVRVGSIRLDWPVRIGRGRNHSPLPDQRDMRLSRAVSLVFFADLKRES
jgi:hypothetical protein